MKSAAHPDFPGYCPADRLDENIFRHKSLGNAGRRHPECAILRTAADIAVVGSTVIFIVHTLSHFDDQAFRLFIIGKRRLPLISFLLSADFFLQLCERYVIRRIENTVFRDNPRDQRCFGDVERRIESLHFVDSHRFTVPHFDFVAGTFLDDDVRSRGGTQSRS